MKMHACWLFSVCLAAALVVGSAGEARADPLTGPTWPPPVGPGFAYSGSGQIGEFGGITYTYTGLDLTDLRKLYWGPWASNAFAISLDGLTFQSYEWLSFSYFSGPNPVWTGRTRLEYFHHGARRWFSSTVGTRMTVSVTDLHNNPISWELLPGYAFPLAPITGSYKANILMEAYFPGDGRYSPAYLPVEYGFDVYDNAPGDYLKYTASFGYYYSEVPEPGSLLLIAVGGAGLVWFRRRRSAKR